jgi:hypothetical protein
LSSSSLLPCVFGNAAATAGGVVAYYLAAMRVFERRRRPASAVGRASAVVTLIRALIRCVAPWFNHMFSVLSIIACLCYPTLTLDSFRFFVSTYFSLISSFLTLARARLRGIDCIGGRRHRRTRCAD